MHIILPCNEWMVPKVHASPTVLMRGDSTALVNWIKGEHEGDAKRHEVSECVRFRKCYGSGGRGTHTDRVKRM